MRDVSKNSTLNPLMDRSKPLTAAMDNLLAGALGEVAMRVERADNIGDYIDRGLILLRLLDEAGFEVRLKSAAEKGHGPGATTREVIEEARRRNGLA